MASYGGRKAYIHMFLCYRRVVVDSPHARITTTCLGYVPYCLVSFMNTVRAGAGECSFHYGKKYTGTPVAWVCGVRWPAGQHSRARTHTVLEKRHAKLEYKGYSSRRDAGLRPKYNRLFQMEEPLVCRPAGGGGTSYPLIQVCRFSAMWARKRRLRVFSVGPPK